MSLAMKLETGISTHGSRDFDICQSKDRNLYFLKKSQYHRADTYMHCEWENQPCVVLPGLVILVACRMKTMWTC